MPFLLRNRTTGSTSVRSGSERHPRRWVMPSGSVYNRGGACSGQKGLKEYFYGRQKEEGGEEGREGGEGISRPWPPHARNTPTGTGTGWPNRICIIICSTQIRLIRYQNFPRPCLHGLCSASPSRAVGVTAMLRKTYFIISRTCRVRPCACRRRRLCVPSFLPSFGQKQNGEQQSRGGRGG